MVIYRSESSLSRTSIHGGLRRGAAAAAVGAVLVLSAGVPASQAADGSAEPTESASVAADGDLAGVSGLLNGLLGGSGGQANASPEPTPAPSGSSTPTVTPSPAPTSPAPTSSAPSTSASPAPQGTTPQGTAPQGAVPPSGAPAPLSTSPDAAGSAAGTQPNGQPGAPADVTRVAGQEADPAADQPTDAHSTNATPVSGPGRHGNAPASRDNMASATAAAAAAEPAKVWLGVGLLGSAGAAGLLFARIRQI
ncbi:hypothetical protein NFC73_02375 [Pseudarthrobacter sp. RMG13]|uniref:Uncharacterized protein n=1 Tax=Pseudarthrobacter humi TaxID=2952523 RepID=A0ABT1LJG4_9MICC|nr:hypothetical protein [Pseudarthrobacter humi]MCP8998585.1 hypothetical protein [Pseudarthrobacter humi]